jgi:hypothetical protein
VLAHYLDDSGISHDSQYAIVGGPVFLQDDFFSFHYEWSRLLARHGVTPPIHMREFGRPHGRLAYLSDEQRRDLFQDLVYLINKRKAWSITVEIDHLEFQQFFPPTKLRKLFGVAPLAFIWCMVLNNGIVKLYAADRVSKVAYVVAKSDLNTAMLECHTFIQSYEENADREFTGTIAFDEPAYVNPLQAADMVAWANRRKAAGGEFDCGFEPLELLTRTVESEVKTGIHSHFKVGGDGTRRLAEIVGSPVRGSVRIPLLQPLPFKPPTIPPKTE